MLHYMEEIWWSIKIFISNNFSFVLFMSVNLFFLVIIILYPVMISSCVTMSWCAIRTIKMLSLIWAWKSCSALIFFHMVIMRFRMPIMISTGSRFPQMTESSRNQCENLVQMNDVQSTSWSTSTEQSIPSHL